MNWSVFNSKCQDLALLLWGWVRNDIWRKVIALLLGAACWGYINQMFVRPNIQQWDSVEDVKISLRSSPKIFIPEQNPAKVRLKISVNFSARSERFTAGDFRLEIDPRKLRLDEGPGQHSLQQACRVKLDVQEHVLRKPAGVTILGFDPPEVDIFFDTREVLQKAVNVLLQGSLKTGFRQKISVHPETISVSGPVSTIAPLLVLETEPLLLNETMLHDFSTSLKIFNPDSRKIQIYPETVEVKVSIQDTLSYSRQKFALIPLSILTRPGSSLQLTSRLPVSVEAILYGQIAALEAVDPGRLMAVLDLTSFHQPGTYHATVQILGLQSDLKAEYINPSSCMLTLNLLPQNPPSTEQTPTEARNNDADQ